MTLKPLLALPALVLAVALAGCAHPAPVVYYQGPPPPPPPAYTNVGQQAYSEGFNAGVRDAQAGRRPNAERHPRFRNPPVPPPAWQEYREAFRAGYRRAFTPA